MICIKLTIFGNYWSKKGHLKRLTSLLSQVCMCVWMHACVHECACTHQVVSEGDFFWHFHILGGAVFGWEKLYAPPTLPGFTNWILQLSSSGNTDIMLALRNNFLYKLVSGTRDEIITCS